jgi:RNA polymerase sigma factor (sigma-70 family)
VVPLKITEENFIEQMKKGNEKALEYVIDNYGWVLKTVLKKHLFYIMDHYEECMNDCLLAIWENVHSYNPEKSDFKNWIGGIAKYKSIDYTRKYLRDLETGNIEDIDVVAEDNPLIEILKNEIDEEVEKMLQNLSEEDRKIFVKYYLKDREIDEISRDTGLSKSVLYNRLSRGRRKIRKKVMMGGDCKNEGL